MNRSVFRASLLEKIALGLGTMLLIPGCGDSTSTTSDGGNAGDGGAGGGSTVQGSTTTASSTGDGGASTGGGGAAATTNGGSTSSGQQGVERCFVGAEPCPAPADAAATFGECTVPEQEKVLAWLEGPVFDPDSGSCCYTVDVSDPNEPSCVGVPGRAFVVDAAPRFAKLVRESSDWSDRSVPWVDRIDPVTRQELARLWTIDAAFEHASVASFGKLALELIAFGAPSQLVELAHVAAVDEIRHAKAAFALASAYAGESLSPGPLTEARSLSLAASLTELAVACLVEGCIGETAAALIAREEAACAIDPCVQEVLAKVADEEASHATLAFRVLAWAIGAGGPDVAREVEQALSAELAATATERDSHTSALIDHGRLDAKAKAAIRADAVAEIVRPTGNAMLFRA